MQQSPTLQAFLLYIEPKQVQADPLHIQPFITSQKALNNLHNKRRRIIARMSSPSLPRVQNKSTVHKQQKAGEIQQLLRGVCV